MSRFLCALVLICSLTFCSKSVDTVEEKVPSSNGYREYIIPKGQHYAAGNNFRALNTRSITFKVRFDSSCIYTASKAENITDINKLYGFSDCSSNHQVNSARFGWTWNGSAIDLYAYCYTEGRRSSMMLGSVAIGREIELALGVEKDKYAFTVGGKKDFMQRSCTVELAEGYQLFPYFGGDEVAPHDVRIFIKDI